MTTKDEALKLALEALEKCRDGFEFTRQYVGREVLPAIEGWSWYDGDVAAVNAITALREALAEQKSGIKQVIELYDSPEQPAQQEPVECKTLCELCVKRSYHFCANSAQTTLIPSPPAQRTWVGLTDEDLAGCDESEYKAARYWETTLKEKNT